MRGETIAALAWHCSQLRAGLPKILRHIVNRLKKVWRRVTGADRFDRLPLLCGARDPSSNRPVAIWRGEVGYFLWTLCMAPEDWNKTHQISAAQVRAMIEGSVFGWPVGKVKDDRPRK